jgi:uncharacterized membrane protein HdeD (DUF308 family)
VVRLPGFVRDDVLPRAAVGTERQPLARLPGFCRPQHRHEPVRQRQRPTRRRRLRVVLHRPAARVHPIVRDRQRLGVEVDVRPAQARDLTAPQARQRQLPGMSETVVGDRRQQRLNLGLGVGRGRFVRLVDPIDGRLTATAERPGLVVVLGPHLWAYALISGVLTEILGAVLLAWPGISILVAAILFGVYLLVSGFVQVIFAFSLHVSAGGRMLLFISGTASLILAVLAVRHFGQGFTVLLLAIWIAVGFIFRGVATTIWAISEPGVPGRGWNIFFGVISLIAGIVVLAFPFDSIVTLALVAGFWLIVIGVMEIISAFGMRREAKIAVRTGAARTTA